jgi:GntR family transcriptional regulator, transcriptional repressor for pyruvate dehydrogenase complex
MMSEAGGAVATRDDLTYEILSYLEWSAEPSGSGSLWEDLARAGVATSPATVGRVLRALDERGDTRRVSNRGRALTEQGRRRLAELRRLREHAESHSLLLESIQPNTLGEILEILAARRAIEREIARLAALRATDRHIETLWTVLAAQEETLHERGLAMDEDRQFHETLAEASGNRVLQATLRLIRRDLDLQRVLEEIRRGRANGLLVDHRRVLEAVARHDAAAAEAAMLGHIDHLIGDLLGYCRSHPDGFDARAVQVLGQRLPGGLHESEAFEETPA